MQAMMDQMKDNRAKDMQFTLDQLARLNRENPILTGVLDLERVGVSGHSFGGASAVRVAQLDARVDALAVLDSDIFLVISEESAPLSQPVLHLTTANIDVTPEERVEIAQSTEKAVAYLSQHAPYYHIQVAGTTHQSIQTDAMFLAPYISVGGEGVTLYASDTTPTRLTQVLTTYVIAFFEQSLKGVPQSLLAGPSEEYPEVTITSNP
jgi:dienelactone hydrolase